MIALESWVHNLSAVLAPITAIMAITTSIVGYFTYCLMRKTRRDQLFDRRYAFYKRVEGIWLSTGNGALYDEAPFFDKEEIEVVAQEAEFLFGSDIANYLRSLAGKQFNGVPGMPDSEFSKRFLKYLCLK